jgi:hypothetical protein
LWHGLEQTAFKFEARLFTKLHHAQHAKRPWDPFEVTKGVIRYCVAQFRSSEIQGKLFEIKDFAQKLPTNEAFLLACVQFEKVVALIIRASNPATSPAALYRIRCIPWQLTKNFRIFLQT